MSRVLWGLAASKGIPAVPVPQVQEVLPALWVQEAPRESAEMSDQKGTPERSGFRAFRAIPALWVQRVTKVPLVLRVIPVLPVLQDRKANAAKKANVDLPVNRGLSECRVHRGS